VDHYSGRRRFGLAIGQRGYHSYRCQRGYFRPDRLFNVSGNISPRLEGADHLSGDTFIIWRRTAIFVHLCAGHKLDGSSVWFHIRGAGGMVDEGRKEKIGPSLSCLFS